MRGPALVLLGVLAVPCAARADDYSIHVLGNVQSAWSDNLFSTETDRQSDVNTQLRPGALLSYETPRTIYQLSYDLEANLYARHTEAWSLSHLASWHGFFLTSPRTEVQVSASYARGTLNTLAPTTIAQQGNDGGNAFWSVEGGQSLSFTMTRELRLSQGARVRKFSTTAGMLESGGTEVGLTTGIDRGWARSALGFGLAGAFVELEPASAQSINANALLSFRRDFSPRWTALVDGGVAGVIPIGTTSMGGSDDIFVQPTVGTNIGYTPRWGQAGLVLRRAMAPNFQLGQNTVTDTAAVNASLPLPWLTEDANRPTLTTQGSLGVSRTQQVVNGDATGVTDVASVDLSLQYAPRPGVGLALRGQHLRQFVEDAAAGGTVTVPYHRTTIVLSLTYRFPDRLAAEMPARDSLRVDRSDNTPVGEEVAPSTAP